MRCKIVLEIYTQLTALAYERTVGSVALSSDPSVFVASAAFGVSFSFAFVACWAAYDDIWDRMNRRTSSGTHSRYRYRAVQLDARARDEFAGEAFSVTDPNTEAHFLCGNRQYKGK